MTRLARWWHRLETGHYPLWVTFWFDSDAPAEVCRTCLREAVMADTRPVRRVGAGPY